MKKCAKCSKKIKGKSYQKFMNQTPISVCKSCAEIISSTTNGKPIDDEIKISTSVRVKASVKAELIEEFGGFQRAFDALILRRK